MNHQPDPRLGLRIFARAVIASCILTMTAFPLIALLHHLSLLVALRAEPAQAAALAAWAIVLRRENRKKRRRQGSAYARAGAA